MLQLKVKLVLNWNKLVRQERTYSSWIDIVFFPDLFTFSVFPNINHRNARGYISIANPLPLILHSSLVLCCLVSYLFAWICCLCLWWRRNPRFAPSFEQGSHILPCLCVGPFFLFRDEFMQIHCQVPIFFICEQRWMSETHGRLCLQTEVSETNKLSGRLNLRPRLH